MVFAQPRADHPDAAQVRWLRQRSGPACFWTMSEPNGRRNFLPNGSPLETRTRFHYAQIAMRRSARETVAGASWSTNTLSQTYDSTSRYHGLAPYRALVHRCSS